MTRRDPLAFGDDDDGLTLGDIQRARAQPEPEHPAATFLRVITASRPKWRDRAACRGMPTEMFYPERAPGKSANVEIHAAQEVCSTCPVQAECAEDGIYEKWGVWGHTTDTERRDLRRARGHRRPGTPLAEWKYDAAKKMKHAGCEWHEIASALGVSRASVAKLLREDVA